MYLFEVVTPTSIETMNFEELKEKHSIRGWNENGKQLEHLQDQPLLKGLVGPMNGGKRGNQFVIRYESMKEYLLND